MNRRVTFRPNVGSKLAAIIEDARRRGEPISPVLHRLAEKKEREK